jgi:hypothetical protein
MTLLARSFRHFADVIGRLLGRFAAMVVGFILMVVGLAMTATIVMLPAGIVLGLLGVAIFVGGWFAPDVRTGRSVDR